jgi:ABC-type bacteriocin/lantibiotic exporter with double-glycine peptidase domain
MAMGQEPGVPTPQERQQSEQISHAGVWLDVPFVPQEKEGCGAAAIAMIMQYWQAKGKIANEPDPAEIQRALYSKEAHGIYASEMKRYLDSNGFQTFAFAGAWDDLDRHLEKGRPLVVAMRPSDASPLHYVVIAGLDWGRGLVLVNDPAQKKLLKLDRSSFEREWNAAGKWTLLAVPQSSAH